MWPRSGDELPFGPPNTNPVPLGPALGRQSVGGLVWPVWPANSATAETWFVHNGAPVFAFSAAIEPSCCPAVIAPLQ